MPFLSVEFTCFHIQVTGSQPYTITEIELTKCFLCSCFGSELLKIEAQETEYSKTQITKFLFLYHLCNNEDC